MYKEGYFSQYLNADGWQLEEYPLNDFSTLPVQPVRNPDQSPLTLTVDLAGSCRGGAGVARAGGAGAALPPGHLRAGQRPGRP